MPVYEFRCRKCGKEFEERRLFSEADKPAQCPTCGGAGDKLISGFGFKMGFYTRPSDKPLRSTESTWSDKDASGGRAKAAKGVRPSAAPKPRRPASKVKSPK
ncbi:MAG: zinc ribbon domain-containing protein [Chloroflexi bacterium]|nr:zinc ribbon domain-containing protein [Chloroflexota bacterium]